MAPGAFFVLALLTAIQNQAKIVGAKKGKDVSKIQSGCGSDCLNCTVGDCADRTVANASSNAESVNEVKEENA